MQNIIMPKTRIKELQTPLIFLAGPIRGAPNWHDDAIEIILSSAKNITVASPSRALKESLRGHLLNGDESFHGQRAWERYYLDIASRNGTIMFWLPGEENHNCEKAYGAMTRIELGQWMTNYKHDKSLRIVMGSDGKFSELDTIKFDLSLDAPDKRILGSLEATCLEAIRMALRT